MNELAKLNYETCYRYIFTYRSSSEEKYLNVYFEKKWKNYETYDR